MMTCNRMKDQALTQPTYRMGSFSQWADADVEICAKHEVLLAAANTGQGITDHNLQREKCHNKRVLS